MSRRTMNYFKIEIKQSSSSYCADSRSSTPDLGETPRSCYVTSSGTFTWPRFSNTIVQQLQHSSGPGRRAHDPPPQPPHETPPSPHPHLYQPDSTYYHVNLPTPTTKHLHSRPYSPWRPSKPYRTPLLPRLQHLAQYPDPRPVPATLLPNPPLRPNPLHPPFHNNPVHRPLRRQQTRLSEAKSRRAECCG